MLLYSRVLSVVRDYIVDADKPVRRWDSERLRQISYRKWAAQECLHYIYDHPYVSPSNAAKAFSYAMDGYITKSKSVDGSLMFAIAKEVGEDLFEMLLAME